LEEAGRLLTGQMEMLPPTGVLVLTIPLKQ
jgi:hypothetical protein